MANTKKFPKYAAALITIAKGVEDVNGAMAQAKADAAAYDAAEQVSTYSESYRKERKAEVWEAAKGRIDPIITKIDNALQTVAEGEEFKAQRLDLSSAPVKMAIDLVNALGSDVPADAQLQIIEDARGDLRGLVFIAKLFEKHKLQHADTAIATTRLVPADTLQRLAMATGKWKMFRKWDSGDTWTVVPEINKLMSRLGVDAKKNPYRNAFREMGNEAQRRAVENAEFVKAFKQANGLAAEADDDLERSGAIYDALLADFSAISERGSLR